MGKVNQSFKMAIQSYLEKRAKEDSLFAASYAKENKSIDECCDYITGEAIMRGGNVVPISDDEVFGMAIHYYDEDNIKINKISTGCRTSVQSSNVELTEEEKKAAREAAREAAIKRLADEQYALLKKKPAKAKKEAIEVQQMLLF